MPHKLKALALSTFCLTLASCGEPKRIVTALTPPAERLVCAPAGPRPVIPAEFKIDWPHVTSVAQAKIEHEGYVRSVRSREGVVTGYIVALEGKLFACSSNMTWLKDWYAATNGR